MEGYCKHCGQARVVKANTEAEANYIATRDCSCEGAEMEAQVEAAEAALEYVAQSENMLSDSILSIKAGKKIKIKRKRDYTVNMEA